MMKKTKPLSSTDADAVWAAINQANIANPNPDDRAPEVVIKEDFGGNETLYLRKMAAHHSVSISS